MAKYRVVIGGVYANSINNSLALDWSHPLSQTNQIPSVSTGATSVRSRSYFFKKGKIENLRAYFSSNSSGGDLTWEIYKNDVATGVSFTMPAGSGAGWFENTTGVVDIAVGDYIQVRVSAASGFTKNFSIISLQADYVTNDATSHISSNSNNALTLSTSGSPAYFTLTGSKAVTNTLTGLYQIIAPCDFNIRAFYVYIATNTRTVDSKVYINKNGTKDTSHYITIPAGSTGLYYITDEISVSEGDLVCAEFDVSGGSGSLGVSNIGIQTKNDSKSYPAVSTSLNILGNATQRYYGAFGNASSNSTVALQRAIRLKGEGVIRNGYHYPYANTATTNGTIGAYINGANANPTINVPTGSTAIVYDTTNTSSYVEDDYLAIRTVRSGSLNSSSGITSFEIVPKGYGGFIPQVINY